MRQQPRLLPALAVALLLHGVALAFLAAQIPVQRSCNLPQFARHAQPLTVSLLADDSGTTAAEAGESGPAVTAAPPVLLARNAPQPSLQEMTFNPPMPTPSPIEPPFPHRVAAAPPLPISVATVDLSAARATMQEAGAANSATNENGFAVSGLAALPDLAGNSGNGGSGGSGGAGNGTATASAVEWGSGRGGGAAYLRNPLPDYPRLARQRGWEGQTILRVEVLVNGRAGQIAVARTSGYPLLDEAATQAVRGWQFRPARQAGVPIVAWVEIPISFQMDGTAN